MADNVAQQIKNLSDEIARLDKGLENTKALADKIFENSSNIGDALQKSFRKGDDAAKETTAVLKELLKTITDNFGNGKELKLAIGIEKNKLRHEIAEAEKELREINKRNDAGAWSTKKKSIDAYKHQLAQLSNFERIFADINKVINGDNGKQMSEISKQRLKDNKEVKKIQEETTAVLQKRIELEERLKTLKPNRKAWRDTKAEIENVNKEVQNYLAKMGSLGTAGARQIKAYEKAGLITNADKTQLALERQQIDLLRQRMQAEEQLNRLLLQRDNAALAGKTVSSKVTDSISRLQERIDTIDKQRLGNYQNFTQVSLQRIEGMWQNHETALTNIKTQGEQARQRIESRNTEQLQIAAQKQIVDILKQQLAIQNQIDKLKQAPQQTQAVQQQIQNLTQQYNQLGSSIRAIANGNQDIINQAQAQVAAQKQHQENIKNTTSALNDSKNQEKAYNDGIKQMQKDEDNARKAIISLMQQQLNIQGQLNRLQNAPATQATQGQIRNLTSQYQALGQQIQTVANGNQQLVHSAQQYVSAQAQAQQNAQQTTNAINAARQQAQQQAKQARQQAQQQAQATRQRIADEKKANAESVSNQKRQMQIKNRLAQLDNNRALNSGKRTREEKNEYAALSRELTNLIKKQKALDAISRGAGSRARSMLESYGAGLHTREAERYRRELEKIDRLHKNMFPTLRRLAGAFGVAFSVQGLVQFGKKLVETTGLFQQQQVAMRSILNNKEVADDIWNKTMQLALQSPFRAMELTRYTKQLAAYRIENDKLFDTTKRLADVSAGLGVDMQRLILAYGQVKAANYLRASEIRQFTEAGVNILGELSRYFSDIEHQSVSTAEVMERVQKRMVTFGDVEEIFKRLTDAGGTFYNMQLVQSRTVRGQINKLHDAYDQMLYAIGTSKQGAINDLIQLALSLVRNWRMVATALTSIGFGAVIGGVVHFVRVLKGVEVQSELSRKALNKLGLSVNGIKKFISGNGLSLTVAAVAAIGTAIVGAYRNMKAYNEELLASATELNRTRENFKNYQAEIEKNNEIIKKGETKTTEYNNAKKRNEEIVNKLKMDYPELAEGIKQETNGIVEGTNVLEQYNEKLSNLIKLRLMGEQTSPLSEGFKKDMEELATGVTKLQGDLINAQTKASMIMTKAEAKGAEDNPIYKTLKSITEIDLSDPIRALKQYKTLYEEYQKLINAPNWKIGKEGDERENIFGGLKNVSGITADYKEAYSEFESQTAMFKKIVEDNILSVDEYAKEISEKNIKPWEWLIGNIGRVKEDTKTGVSDIFADVREHLLSEASGNMQEMRPILNAMFNELLIDPFLSNAQKSIVNKSADSLALLATLGVKPATDAVQNQVDLFLMKTQESTREANPQKDKGGKKTASKLISLIREMRAEYDKLSKSAYGYAKSEDAVRKAYDKAMDAILVKAGVDKKYDFTTNEGMIAALEKVKAYADKLGPEAAAEVEKYIGQLKSEIELNVQVKVRDDFNRDLEKMFSNYELTLELQGLNIPEGMAKDLFPDLDYTTLGEIQDRMRKFYEDQRNANGEVLFDKDDLEQYRKWSDKVDAEILKSRKEKAKQYSKYLEKEYSDRAKLEMQHAKDVAFVTANVSDETQRKNIITQIDKKYQDDLNELHWKSFKESSFYVEMMDDISSLPKEYMQMMLDKIEEILQHPETLSPRALKEAINARQKVIEAQMNLEPLDVMRSSMKKIREAMSDDSVGGQTMRQTRKNLDAQIAKTQELINEKEDEARCWDETAAAMQIYENAQQEVADAYGKLSSVTREFANQEGAENAITERQTELDANRTQIENNQKLLDELNKKQREGVQLTESEQNQLSGLKDQNATLEARNRLLSEEIAHLNEVIEKEKQLATIRSQQVGTDAEMQRGEGGVGTAAEARNRAQESQAEADNLEKANQKLKAWKKSFKDFADSMEKWNASVANMINKVSDLGNAFYDTFDALGGETNALTEGWREFGNTMTQTITSALSLIPQLVTGFITAGSSINAAMGVIGLIAEAIQLVLVAVGAIAKLHDAHYEREIEIQQKKIDDLKDAYARLERQIEQTFTTSSYMREFNEQIENLREQMAALEAQRSAESSKKNADADRVREYTNAIIDAQDEIDELGQRQIEVFGGIGKDNYRSWAEGFVDAWKDAFLETGDGLDALQDHFDEFLQEWFVKQATMRIAGKALEGVMGDIDKVVSDNGVVDWAELQRIKDQMDLILPDLNDKLTAFAGMWDFGGEGGLSGLAAGIQGMTEEQANILEAYWNSVRMYTASIDGNVSRIAEMLCANDMKSNPMLQQMTLIAANTRAIHTLLQAVVKSGHPQGGYGVKVFND